MVETASQHLASEMGNYVYSTITASGTIRLILLEPSTDLEAAVKLSLVEALLRDCEDDIVEHYVALSYVWGDASQRRVITIDGKTLSITKSLECALRYIRDSKRVLRIWADGISINQSDLRERNTQVAMMGRIYSTAGHTIIFLGKANADNQFLQTMADCACRSKRVRGCGAADDSDIGILLANEWFTRAWTLQELVLSSIPWIQYGTLRVRWDLFQRHAISQDEEGPPTKQLSLFSDMAKLRLEYQERQLELMREMPDALSSILSKRCGSSCSDPRDIVYAHLGMCDGNAQIEVDYSKSVAEVYTDAARNFVSASGDLSILTLVDTIGQRARPPGLPTWVPDWGGPATCGINNHCEDYISAYLSVRSPNILGFMASNFAKVVHVPRADDSIQRHSWDSDSPVNATYQAVLDYIVRYIVTNPSSEPVFVDEPIPADEPVSVDEPVSMDATLDPYPRSLSPVIETMLHQLASTHKYGSSSWLKKSCLAHWVLYILEYFRRHDVVFVEDKDGLHCRITYGSGACVGDELFVTEKSAAVLIRPLTTTLSPDIEEEIKTLQGGGARDPIKIQCCKFVELCSNSRFILVKKYTDGTPLFPMEDIIYAVH